jgi:hypothetical protein
VCTCGTRDSVGVRLFALKGGCDLPFFCLGADVVVRWARRNGCGDRAAKMGRGKDSGGGAAVASCDGAGRFAGVAIVEG